ncbi:MAG: TadE/TadG family type IV pilus assembly protein [Pirellulales bacterium]
MTRKSSNRLRRGAIVPLVAVILVVLIGMVAFSVDIGYILVARTEAQNAADSAALAGIARLAEQLKRAPVIGGVPLQTAGDLQRVRDEVKAFARRNAVRSNAPELLDADIEIGYMATPYDHRDDTLDKTGWPARPYNAVRVVVARDSSHAGGPLDLFFAPVLGTDQANTRASATTAITMGSIHPRGNHGPYRGGILPFTFQVDEWNALLGANSTGKVLAANGATITLTDNFTVDPQSTGPGGVHSGGDGRFEVCMYPNGTTSGNYGTINFSKTKAGNSTNVLRDLIVNGPAEADWPDLPDILAATHGKPVGVNGDPGLSAGMAPAVEAIVGESRILPLYSTVAGQGNNTYYEIVGFTPITIVKVEFQGSQKSAIMIQPDIVSLKSFVGDGNQLYFDVSPGTDPYALYLGARALVR